ncbi:hypothetical protein A4H97_10220 [Niastella yeongjuensis]|uniref:Uncharacterized protein n=1 Tax=Niastella yeongjuensis TaxID=354355 RepID=A0A1V9EF08_9BACT|nr:hypothetical protein A4H97_10220 [Niastella yeongjuensis]
MGTKYGFTGYCFKEYLDSGTVQFFYGFLDTLQIRATRVAVKSGLNRSGFNCDYFRSFKVYVLLL